MPPFGTINSPLFTIPRDVDILSNSCCLKSFVFSALNAKLGDNKGSNKGNKNSGSLSFTKGKESPSHCCAFSGVRMF